MKWFKHMTRSWNDEGLAKLVGPGGMEGLARYGLWWRVLEIIGEQMAAGSSKCSVTYPVARWSLLLSLRGSLVFSTLSTLPVTGGVSVTRDGDDVTVTIPNLLKYRDEYTKKSGHSPEDVHPRTEGDRELDRDKEQKKKKTITQSVPPEELAGTLPLVDGSEYEVTRTQVSDWQKAFPGIEVRQELKRFKEWLKANPKRKKTRGGIARAAYNWLGRAQDQSRGGNKNAPVPNSRADENMGVFQEFVNGREHRSASDETGDFSAGEDRQDQYGDVHRGPRLVGPSGVSGCGDEDRVLVTAGGGAGVSLPWDDPRSDG